MLVFFCSPEDGHNDARNMLRQKLITHIWLLHHVGFFCSPEDGHDDARNMLRQKLIINIWLLHLVGFLSLSLLTFWMLNLAVATQQISLSRVEEPWSRFVVILTSSVTARLRSRKCHLIYSMYSVFWCQKVVHKFREPCGPHFHILPQYFQQNYAVFAFHTKLCTVSHEPSRMRQTVRECHSKIVGSSVCNGLNVTLLAPRIWNWVLDWKMCGPLLLDMFTGCC